jgi:hypothetical protein
VDQAVARRALLVAILLFATACATGRSQAQLDATAFGRMATPPGSKTLSESYNASQWNVEGPNCAFLTRTYAAKDAEGFLAAFRAHARASGVVSTGTSPTPQFYDATRSNFGSGATAEGDGTYVQVDFHDTRDLSWWPTGVDPREWPFIIVMRIGDATINYGGGCGQ